MKKSLLVAMLAYSIFVYSETAYANESNEVRPFEEIYPQIGYQTVEEAIKEFEQEFKQGLILPVMVPHLSFTHHFGRFVDDDGDINDTLELEFINVYSPENHYKIDVRPLNHKIPIYKYIVQLFNLKTGNEANYIEFSDYYALVFERDNWQYMLSLNKKVSEMITPDVLVEIADSIDYPIEKENLK